MAVTTISVTDGICPVFPSRLRNFSLSYWNSTLPLSSVAFDRVNAAKFRFLSLVNDRFSDKRRLRATVNPYTYSEAVRPEKRKSLSDFFVEVRDFVGSDGGDGGPPRWFSPLECRVRAPGSPLLLYIPGIDGTGLGLIRQHRRLGEIFDIWCLHFPVRDRTPARELVKLIERTVRSENYRFPDRPIYIVGESIGACLALDVAASNPDIDLVLILANPVTRVNNFMLQPLMGLLEIPSFIEDHFLFKQGYPFLGMLHAIMNESDVPKIAEEYLGDFYATSANLPTLFEIFPKETLLWKLELIKSASASAFSHIYTVKAQTLILLSGHNQWFLNREDIERLCCAVPKCDVRKLEDNGPFPFLEDGVDLVTIIKYAYLYRRGKSHDHISDYFRPTPFEFKQYEESQRWLTAAISPVLLSTLENGTVVRSLAGIPSEGPVLLVGNHMLLGIDLCPTAIQFMKERNIILRGMAHPVMFSKKGGAKLPDLQMYDSFKIIGAVPVSNVNFYKLLQSKAHVVLYPGGVREALHRKGEEYKLFWPEHSEFVRIASKFGAKIIPFGVIGEDDICEIFLDYNDQMKIPFLKNFIEELTQDADSLRNNEKGEIGKQDLHIPGIIPKIPGRVYLNFGKAIETKGREIELKDRENAHKLYLQVKSEVENCVNYLIIKREKDPYRNIVSRLLYHLSHGFSAQIPTFDLRNQ